MHKTRAFTARAIYAARLLARDDSVPTPLRWMLLIGLLPIPGPIDEAMLLVVASLLFIFGREAMRGAWRRAKTERFAKRLAVP